MYIQTNILLQWSTIELKVEAIIADSRFCDEKTVCHNRCCYFKKKKKRKGEGLCNATRANDYVVPMVTCKGQILIAKIISFLLSNDSF